MKIMAVKIISKYLKKDSVIRVLLKICENLIKILANLINNKKIKVYSNNIKRDANKFLISRDLRITKRVITYREVD